MWLFSNALLQIDGICGIIMFVYKYLLRLRINIFRWEVKLTACMISVCAFI